MKKMIKGPVMNDDETFPDVEAFLADHGVSLSDNADLGEVSESEAAEALAVTWKERRKEIQKVNQSRRFGQPSFAASSSSRSFRVDVEELKRRTRCRKCGKVGHWARECRENKSSGTSHKPEPPSSAAGAGIGAVRWSCGVLFMVHSSQGSHGCFVDIISGQRSCGQWLRPHSDWCCYSGCGSKDVG